MATTDFITFRKFADQAYAKEFSVVLERLAIPYEIESSGLLNPMAMDAAREYYVKIKGIDFTRANGAIRAFYAAQVQQAEADYYLFSFSQEELRELVEHPDEWSDFDYALASKILKDKGINTEEKSKTVLIEELNSVKKEKEIPRFTEDDLMRGIMTSLVGGFMGVWTGWNVLNDKIILPNGEEDYAYSEPDRKRGGTLFAVGGALLFAYVLISIILIYKVS
ncbi:MAG: hypothetical protein H7282_06130 [Cytophagaceae bacterium]|nr:hypothetical protein [Cytophagaceae bacterium]